MVESPSLHAYEFFAGGGMLRAGLGDGWTCTFANDIDPQKAAFYRANWGGEELAVGDIGALTPQDLPGQADLMWGSFPCQDLSLAGNGKGLGGARSGTFHAFWGLANGLLREGRGPKIVAIENVCGALTSRGGRDFEILCRTWDEAGYAFGALVINADRFVPQSRPRLFVVGVRGDVKIDPALLASGPEGPFHPVNLRRAVERLPADLRSRALWWRLPEPEAAPPSLAAVTETDGPHLEWHNQAQTARLLELMSPLNRAKVEAAQASGTRQVGALYRRTRKDAEGCKVQRAEVRFDMAGCLRTPGGGSSRQTLVVVEHGRVRSRLMTARETARLMGLSDDYRLPGSYSAACKLTGDGVAAPVVGHLSRWLFEPLAKAATGTAKAA
ncbi:DNA cytosine methyltransferase [Brevundimonas sp.]|uniref:DNA cytosine methyltransferase n=1 Tax=Brevundimonas sp. TaxID=1871086 RepID=UPI002EDAD968